MPINVQCANARCKMVLQAPDDLAGKRAKCPGCKQVLTIPDPTAADPLVGSTLGPITIEKKLGQGAMGAVYLGQNTTLDRTVAVKVLPEELVRDNPTYLKRFRREAKMAGMLNHPNAVMVYTVDEDEGRHYIEMEFVQGVDFREIVRKLGRVKVKEASRVVKDVAGALATAHEQNIVHRDIKPENIMLTTEGQVKVADFGLAKIGNVESSITLAGQVFGTPLYMSPEHAQGRPLDGRSDIYSLGATFYHALVGGPPFTAKTAFDVVMKHTQEPLAWPEGMEDIPAATRAIVEKMMAKSPDERYQTCEELIRAIDGEDVVPAAQAVPTSHATEEEFVEVEPVRRSRTPARAASSSAIPTWLWVLVALALLSILAAAAYVTLSMSR